MNSKRLNQSKECGTQITWRTSSACLVYDNDRKSILFFTPQVLITCKERITAHNFKEAYIKAHANYTYFDDRKLIKTWK